MESVGLRLKKIRLEKGFTLEEARKKTKIHLNVLKAIEEDSLVGLSPVYIKGFLKIYCKFLGLDPAGYIPNYKEPQQSVSSNVLDKREGSSSLFKSASQGLDLFRRHINKIKIAAITIVIICATIGLFNLRERIASSRRLSRTREVKPVVGLVEKIGKKKAPRTEQAESAKIIAKNRNDVAPDKGIALEKRLVVSAREDCYVQVKTDGRTVFGGILKKGRSETWKAKEKIELFLGNAGAVELEVNGQNFSNLGRKGQPLKNILIDKEGLSIKR